MRDRSVAPSRVKEPETFNGSDTRKLHSFLVQCKLNFQDCPVTFTRDLVKVNFAILYLHGTALQFFKPILLGEVPAEAWLINWDLFVFELRNNFGPHDPVGDAEAEINCLHMKDSDRITKYNVEFNWISARLQWSENALRHNYYRGLPNCIKDEIARTGKPPTLRAL